MKKILVILSILLLSSIASSKGKVDLTFDHYYDGPAVVDAVKKLNQAYPELTELKSLGKTIEGRDIWMLMINNPKTGNDLSKPGIYVDGTIHGNEVQATEVCLYLAWYLLDSYGENEMITNLVNSRAFYIVPVMNVDNRWHFFEDPGGYNIGRSARVPYDDDRDGLKDEDGPEDIDGDGEILRMRIKDPFGDYITHPEDPQVMIRREPWEKGEYRMLGTEGIDNDNDGQINEDGVGYLDMNRNFGFEWQPPYVEEGAGDFPMSCANNKAIVDFVKTKPNLCFDFAFHNMGGLWVRGPGSNLAGFYAPSDVRVYDFLGEASERITPGYQYIIGVKDMYTTNGDFDEFMYSALGVYGFVGELFTSAQENYRHISEYDFEEEDDDDNPGRGSRYEDSRDLEKQKYNRNVNQGKMFKEWTKFNHPTLGEIEIGGWRTFTTRIPQPYYLPEMVHRNASMVIFTASNTPDIAIEHLETKEIGNGLKQIRIRLTNKNALPSLSAKAINENMYREDMVTIQGSGLEVISGGIVRDLLYDRVNFVKERSQIIFTSVPSFGKRDIQWIVKGSGKATITYDALKATNRTLTIDL